MDCSCCRTRRRDSSSASRACFKAACSGVSRCFDSAWFAAADCCSSTDLLSQPRAMSSIIAFPFGKSVPGWHYRAISGKIRIRVTWILGKDSPDHNLNCENDFCKPVNFSLWFAASPGIAGSPRGLTERIASSTVLATPILRKLSAAEYGLEPSRGTQLTRDILDACS
jgi:hypothetical protein